MSFHWLKFFLIINGSAKVNKLRLETRFVTTVAESSSLFIFYIALLLSKEIAN